MIPSYRRGYSALSQGRCSAAGEEYFLTFNLQRPQRGLDRQPLLAYLRVEIEATELDGLWHLRTGVVMPDHLHLLVQLGKRGTLSEAVRRYKGRSAPPLQRMGLDWQRSFFDHRMRHGEDRLPVFLYIFLNPYRARLVGSGRVWPGFWCAEDDWKWFQPLTNSGVPFPEWLRGFAD